MVLLYIRNRVLSKTRIAKELKMIYKIVLLGAADGQDPKAVQAALAGKLKVDPAKLSGAFQGKPMVLKKNIDDPAAKKYKQVMEKTGAACRIENMAPETEAQKEMTCPSCRRRQPEADECVQCGIIVSKVKYALAPQAPPKTFIEEPKRFQLYLFPFLILVTALLVGSVLMVRKWDSSAKIYFSAQKNEEPIYTEWKVGKLEKIHKAELQDFMVSVGNLTAYGHSEIRGENVTVFLKKEYGKLILQRIEYLIEDEPIILPPAGYFKQIENAAREEIRNKLLAYATRIWKQKEAAISNSSGDSNQ